MRARGTCLEIVIGLPKFWNCEDANRFEKMEELEKWREAHTVQSLKEHEWMGPQLWPAPQENVEKIRKLQTGKERKKSKEEVTFEWVENPITTTYSTSNIQKLEGTRGIQWACGNCRKVKGASSSNVKVVGPSNFFCTYEYKVNLYAWTQRDLALVIGTHRNWNTQLLGSLTRDLWLQTNAVSWVSDRFSDLMFIGLLDALPGNDWIANFWSWACLWPGNGNVS